MKTRNVSVRGVGEFIWKDFRAYVVKRGVDMGEATTEALRLYLKTKRERKPRYKFLDLNPVDFGPGNENLSEKIDEILYGDEQ